VNIRKRLSRESSVSKFNIGTELRMAFGNALRKSLTDNQDSFDRIRLLSPTIDAVKSVTIEVIRALNGKPE
jgi:fructose-bisphosphate aldolase class II